jgi:cytochrome b subunit of formate dehydrogenase
MSDKAQTKDTDRKAYFIRFGLRQRAEHIALMVTFTVLAVTGLAQRFYDVGPAERFILGLGGVETVRDIHRIFGAIFALGLVYHLVFLAYGLLTRRARQSMLVTRKDFSDVLDSLRYALGFGSRPPQFGRYNYREKFEYWGLMFGSVIITLTGAVLMFPIIVTRVLPGQVVAASVEVHGWEATLAVLTIVVWHLYEVVLRPGIFPGDTTIFTGRISKQRMLEEHYLEYVELTATEEQLIAMASPADHETEPPGDNNNSPKDFGGAQNALPAD